MFEEMIEKLSEQKEVLAITLGGSRARNMHDIHSDYDVYVYTSVQINEEARRHILDSYVKYMEYSNAFWELEDDGELKDGTEIEFIYRIAEEFEEMLSNIYFKKQVGHGFTTCFLDNLLHSKTLYEKDAYITNLQNQYRPLMNKELVQAIVTYNYPIIMERIPALYKQVEKAVKRNDLHSINHRLTEYFSIFYDILFAINNVTHPGEKRMLEYASKLDLKPDNLEGLVHIIFEQAFHNNEVMLDALKELSMELKKVLQVTKYID